MRLFFGHPIWSVAEAAATTLSALILEDKDKQADRLAIIAALLADASNWRVQFGANEAAFAVRHADEELFFKSVETHFAHRICKIRGLCAENLISLLLNSSKPKRSDLMYRFRAQITAWVSDQDCWVLEHVYRLYNTLEKRAAIAETQDVKGCDLSAATLSRDSLLLKDRQDWWKISRDDFLRHIEKVKVATAGGAA